MDEDLKQKIIDEYRATANKSQTALNLGISRTTVTKYLADHPPLFHGNTSYVKANDMKLPTKGKIRRYLLTAAQNNTDVHMQFLMNLEAYSRYLGAELMVARFTYNLQAYSSSQSVKPGYQPKWDGKEEAWWHPSLEEYICDDIERHGSCRYQLAPGLQWCAEMNILPTAILPLSGLDSYTKRDSAIFPHAKIAMQSVASPRTHPAKFNYTTGCVTKRNYVKKKMGLKAEEHHRYGAALVEVCDNGDWWVRQIEADESGTFYDVPSKNKGVTKVENGVVTWDHRLEAINWGDIHASECDPEVINQCWGNKSSVIDAVNPKYQFMHDVQSFRSRSHHEIKKFGAMFRKWLDGTEDVLDEIKTTGMVLEIADRPDTKMVVVSSNHDRHGERWLDEADYRQDPVNAEIFLEAQLSRVRAMKEERQWDFNEWSLRTHGGVPEDTIFLKQDDSFVICDDWDGGIECGMHGDEGPNGARGNTSNLRQLGRKTNKGHDHKATIMDNVYSAGALQLNFGYQSGPSSHSISHIFTYPNGTRSIVTVWDGSWRAE